MIDGLIIQFDSNKGSMKLIIGDESISIDHFVCDGSGKIFQAVVNELGQKQLSRKIINNIL